MFTSYIHQFVCLVLSLLLTSALSGCASREHMGEGFGERRNEFFAKQRAYPTASVEAPTGLDSEEAALVHAAYRKALGGGKEAARDPGSRVLIVQENEKK